MSFTSDLFYEQRLFASGKQPAHPKEHVTEFDSLLSLKYVISKPPSNSETKQPAHPKEHVTEFDSLLSLKYVISKPPLKF